MERLRKNFYPLWKALTEASEDPTLPERWSRESRQHAETLEVLRVPMRD